MAMAVKATYVGNGEYLNGVPARDLGEDEWSRFSDEVRARIEGSPLYELQPSGAKPKKAEKDEGDS